MPRGVASRAILSPMRNVRSGQKQGEGGCRIGPLVAHPSPQEFRRVDLGGLDGRLMNVALIGFGCRPDIKVKWNCTSDTKEEEEPT
jgi:hypothetical protein